MRVSRLTTVVALALPVAARGQSIPESSVTAWTRTQIELVGIPAADSLYLLGRRALNQAQYEAAARTLGLVFKRYPTALVAPNALYWQGYAFYQAGMERRSAPDLDLARRSLLIHRTLYEQSLLRSDAITLLRRIRTVRDSYPDPPLDGGSDWVPLGCNGPSLERQVALLSEVASLPPERAALYLDEVVMGPGQCLDLSPAVGLYARIGAGTSGPLLMRTAVTRESKELVIGALGRSIHPTAANELLAIVRMERDVELRGQAVQWLRARGDPRIEAVLRSLGGGELR